MMIEPGFLSRGGIIRYYPFESLLLDAVGGMNGWQ